MRWLSNWKDVLRVSWRQLVSTEELKTGWIFIVLMKNSINLINQSSNYNGGLSIILQLLNLNIERPLTSSPITSSHLFLLRYGKVTLLDLLDEYVCTPSLKIYLDYYTNN